MHIQALLQEMVSHKASDLYITTNSPPLIRLEGATQPIGEHPLAADDAEQLALALMSEKERAQFEESLELNLGIEIAGIGRFRVNVHRQRDQVGMVIRHVTTSIPTLDQLKLPEVFKEITMQKRGLVLVTGATGSGKSTTLAAMLNYRNEHCDGHIVTVEDPIEFIHPNKGCIFTQREIGMDTHSFNGALKNALRQAPDVIMIGEIRDRETMEAAITFADTGHLCLGTLHSSNANQTLHRVMNFFPGERHDEIYLQLSMCLRAIISQRLIPGMDGKRLAALEVLRDTPWVRDLIKQGEVDKVKDGMQQGSGGCQTFDQDLLCLWSEGKILAEVAMANADYPNNLRLCMQQRTVSPEPEAEAPGGNGKSADETESAPKSSYSTQWSLEERSKPNPAAAMINRHS